MPITALPTPPSRLDSTNFATRADAFMTALPVFANEANALQSDVNSKQTTASTAASNASSSASAASTAAASAATSKAGADTARDAAIAAQNSAALSYDNFDDRYLGAKGAAPALDNDGAALLTGALYWDTTIPALRAWNGSAWVTLAGATAGAIAITPAGNIASVTVQGAIDELASEKADEAQAAYTVSGGGRIPRSLITGTDFNTVLSAGTYNLDTTGSLNTPNGGIGWGFLDVRMHIFGSEWVGQTYYDMSGSGAGKPPSVWNRRRYAGVWEPWAGVANLASPTFTGTATFSEGSSNSPSISFANDGAPDTGFYHISDGVFGVTCNTQPIAKFQPLGMELQGAPTAPTPATADRGQTLANAAYVHRAIGGQLVKPVGGGVDVTLSAEEFGYGVLSFTGVLTANIAVIVPSQSHKFGVYNATNGPFQLTVKTAAGGGVMVSQGLRESLWTDGLNVFSLDNDFRDVGLTGVPTAPTAPPGTNSLQLATTAFAQSAIAARASLQPLLNPVGVQVFTAPSDDRQIFTQTGRTTRGWNTAQTENYCPTGSPVDFASTSFHVQDVNNAQQIGYDGNNAVVGHFDYNGVAVHVWPVSGTGNGIITSSGGVLGVAVPGVDYAPASLQDQVTGKYAKTGGPISGPAYTTPVSVAFSTTPAFDAALSNVFYLGALTANVTSSTISNPNNGQTINIRFEQDGVGGRTVTPPANSKVGGSFETAAGRSNWLSLTYVAPAARWEGAWSIVAP